MNGDTRMTMLPTAGMPLRLSPLGGPPLEPVTLPAGGPAGGAAKAGRSRACEVWLADPAVSRVHASIGCIDGLWMVRDEGSRHGTLLNGVALAASEWATLRAGDELAIGPWTMRVGFGGSDVPATARSSAVQATVAQVMKPARGEIVEQLDERKLGQLAQQRLHLLIECAGRIHGAEDERTLAAAVVESALQGTGYGRAALLRTRGEGESGVSVELLSALVRGADPGEGSPTFPVSASLILEASKGRAARLGGYAASGIADYGQSIADLRIHSALCLPVEVAGKVDSYLYLDARGGEGGGQTDAAEFCVALARFCGLAIANRQRAELARGKQAIEKQLGAAREAQQMIVPPPSGRVGVLDYALRMRPGMVVAGDLFDILELPEGRVAFFLGDVTGEGVSAGILMAGAQSYLHAALTRYGEPAAAVNEVNRYLASHTPADRFISLWVGVLDHARQELRYVDAGHGYCVHVPEGGKPAMVRGTGGIPAAIDEGIRYEAASMGFAPGDRLVLFSDGVVEQSRPMVDVGTMAGDQAAPRRMTRDDFGLTRVLDVVARCKSPDEDTRRLLAAVLEHAETEALKDDTTIASVQWRAGVPENLG